MTGAAAELNATFAGVAAGDQDAAAAAACAMLGDTGWVEALLAGWAAALRADAWFQPPTRAARDPLRCSLVLAQVAAGTVIASVLSAAALAVRTPAATVVTSGRVSVTRYQRAGVATLRRWHAGTVAEPFDADTAAALVVLPSRRLADGEIVVCDGRCEAQLLEGIEEDVVTVSFAAAGGGLTREYDRESGRLIRAASNDAAASRTRMLLTLLRVSGRADAGDAFDAATRTEEFHLRWAAMREWLALDARAALPRLHALADADPHPQVRAAARATLPLVEERLCRA